MASGTSQSHDRNRHPLGPATEDDLAIILTEPPQDGQEAVLDPERTQKTPSHRDSTENREADPTRLGPQQRRESQPPGHLSPEDRSASWPAVSGTQHIPSFRKRIEAYLRRSAKLDRTRDKVLFLRKQVVYERGEYWNKLRDVEESQGTFFKQLDAMIRNEEFVALRPQLLGIYGQSRGDYLVLEEQSGKIKRLDDQLSQLEYSMQEQEKRSAETADKLLAVIRRFDPSKKGEDFHEFGVTLAASTDEPSTSENVADSTDAESSVTPSALAEYYDKAGDVNIMKDRLHELDNDHRDMLTSRMMREDQELDVPFSGTELEQYQVERKVVEKLLDDAISASQRALAVCLAQGLYPATGEQTSLDPAEMVTAMPTIPELPRSMQSTAPWLSEGGLGTSSGLLITPEILGDSTVDTEDLQQSRTDATSVIERWRYSINEHETNPWVEQTNVAEQASPRPQPTARSSFASRSAQIRARGGTADDHNGLSSYDLDAPRSYKSLRGASNMVVRARTRTAVRSRSSSDSELSFLRKLNPPHDIILRRPSDAYSR